MKTIKAQPVGGNSWEIIINGDFVETVENDGSSFDAVEDYLLSIGENVDEYEVVETV